MTILIISEKPQAALKIATALADDKIKKKQKESVIYYEISHKGKKIIVAAAVGHLYNLAERSKKGWTYPVFDVVWKEAYLTSKSAIFTKKYLDTIKRLCKECDDFVIATDKDLEGELIGYNVVRFGCNMKDAKRMEFSTLTKDDLINSYEHAKQHIDFSLAYSGETRHYADYYYGINLSRALSLSIKTTGRFAILSTGRVQGPALKLVVDKEKEIRAFKPVPYWQIELIGEIKNALLSAWHKEGKFWDKKKADAVLKNVKGREAVVKDVRRTRFDQLPPAPFDLTTLQMEAYRLFKINPKQTLEIAQNLYLAGLISYPRTSSQQFPESINFKKIMNALSKQKKYTKLCKDLLKNILRPHNGKKKDPAHPAIHPTGEIAELKERELKIYDLVVKRTLATFSSKAARETVEIEVDVNKEIFVAKGSRTLEKGWHAFYEPYIKLEEVELPEIMAGDKLSVKDIKLHSKETQPPKRYTPASIVKELDKRNLGTKSTRSEIIDTLYQRNYIKNESIEATELGIKTIETLEKYIPEIIDENLTRHFEKEMDAVQEGKKKKEEVLDEAKNVLTKILSQFKKKEVDIGKGLVEAISETRKAETLVGNCPACKEGILRITYSRKNKQYFVACDKYPECRTTFSIPKYALPKPAKKNCECGFPILLMVRKGRRPYEFCINPNCPKREERMKHEGYLF